MEELNTDRMEVAIVAATLQLVSMNVELEQILNSLIQSDTNEPAIQVEEAIEELSIQHSHFFGTLSTLRCHLMVRLGGYETPPEIAREVKQSDLTKEDKEKIVAFVTSLSKEDVGRVVSLAREELGKPVDNAKR